MGNGGYWVQSRTIPRDAIMPRTETSTGQQTAKGTAPAKLRLADYQIEVVDPVTQAVTALGALEIADYAEELQRP